MTSPMPEPEPEDTPVPEPVDKWPSGVDLGPQDDYEEDDGGVPV